MEISITWNRSLYVYKIYIEEVSFFYSELLEQINFFRLLRWACVSVQFSLIIQQTTTTNLVSKSAQVTKKLFYKHVKFIWIILTDKLMSYIPVWSSFSLLFQLVKGFLSKETNLIASSRWICTSPSSWTSMWEQWIKSSC